MEYPESFHRSHNGEYNNCPPGNREEPKTGVETKKARRVLGSMNCGNSGL